ncbi:Glycosyltransferase involved in cell wall bisynthesis [Formosa sp. Hel1_31_208]|uniref:glycosyltransferase family 2 protein n=1 Tax=Formosa sp. Hel1_31_208 TaxID=1798225 RepID=UPI00087D6290|nr:glycosyltransferase [Formosa sp. Hel1_31_208]SDS69396.1 Glycosyltransferase involved in cell wall bisynthesis [Formosa sp. Hel1_31_208]
MIQDPLVSVCMITYNQDKYIKKALESILMQKTKFSFEVIIGNDSSTDNTDKIIRSLINETASRIIIKYINRKDNIGMTANLTDILGSSRGKYIALCEGDDYWTDPLKLQKQVNFLEENEDYNLCFHEVEILEGEIFLEKNIAKERYNNIKNKSHTLIDLLTQGNFIHTASVMYRNQPVNFPFELKYSSVADYFLHIIYTNSGNIKKLHEKMAVYRLGVGVYSTLNDAQMHTKILNYQSCILSYLTEEPQKEILLKKQLVSLSRVDEVHKKEYLDVNYLAKNVSFKKFFKILITKIKILIR